MYKTVREEIAIELRNRILKGEIKQGDRIKETELAEEFGVSRGPIREVFRQLEQEGLIEYSSRKGCTVKTISASDSAEYYMLRANLENLAVRLCDGKYPEEVLNEMYEIIKRMDEYSKFEDLIGIIGCDQKFHELIIKEAKKEKLFEMWSTLNNANAIIFYALYHSRYSPKEKLAGNHKLIVDAMKEGNPDIICDLIQEHYLIVSKNLYKTENIDVDFQIKL
ncbi:MAG: GntR family transcriptional regulator [Lachnospiraceae bacterium]